jgi:AraC-like DNA-binding protein
VGAVEMHSDIIVDVSCGELRHVMETHDKLRYQVVDLNAMLGSLADDPLSQASLVVLGINRLGHEQCHQLIRRIRDVYPCLSVYVLGRRADRLAARVRGYATAGAGDVFELESDHDLRAFRETAHNRLAALPPRQLITEVNSLTRGSPVNSIAVDCLVESFRRRTVEAIEQRFGRHHKVINEQLRSSRIVSVGQLLRVGRLAHAVELAARRRLTREETASILGFSSAKSLAAALRRAKLSGLYANGHFTFLAR